MVGFVAACAIQVVSVTIKSKSYSCFYAWFDYFDRNPPDCVARAKGDCHFTFGVGSFYFRRLICRMGAAGANYFEAGRQASGFRTFTDRNAYGFANWLFVRARRMSCFATACASIANEGVRVEACITPRFGRRYLTRARSLDVTLAA